MKDKKVLITGAANGIGKSLAFEIAKRKGIVIITDVNIERLKNTKNELEHSYAEIYSFELDVSDETMIKQTSQKIENEFGHIDILINNAGIYVASPFEEIELEKFKRTFDINFWGGVYCTKYFLPLLRKSPQGVIVNILSDFGLIGFPNKVAYCSSKFALRGFSNTLVTEFQQTNIKIIQVFPPAVDTGLVKEGDVWREEKKILEANFLKNKGIPIEKVAKTITNGIERRKSVIKIGLTVMLIDLISRLFPIGILKLIGRNKHKFKFV